MNSSPSSLLMHRHRRTNSASTNSGRTEVVNETRELEHYCLLKLVNSVSEMRGELDNLLKQAESLQLQIDESEIVHDAHMKELRLRLNEVEAGAPAPGAKPRPPPHDSVLSTRNRTTIDDFSFADIEAELSDTHSVAGELVAGIPGAVITAGQRLGEDIEALEIGAPICAPIDTQIYRSNTQSSRLSSTRNSLSSSSPGRAPSTSSRTPSDASIARNRETLKARILARKSKNAEMMRPPALTLSRVIEGHENNSSDASHEITEDNGPDMDTKMQHYNSKQLLEPLSYGEPTSNFLSPEQISYLFSD